MHFTDIQNLTRAVPFQPFRVFLTTGETFDIHHPDMILATLGSAHIAVPPPNGPPDDVYRVKIVSLVHIQKFEFLPNATPAQPGTNGAA